MAGLTSAKRWRLRRIFLQKRPSYSPTEAAKVLGMPRPQVVGMIDAREVDAEPKVTTTYRLPWLSVAEVAMQRYSVDDLIAALGKQAANVVPPLLFPSDPIQVTLPLYLVRLLEYLAAYEKVTVDEALASLLRAYTEELSLPTPQQIEEAIPGFHAAFMFPDKPEVFP